MREFVKNYKNIKADVLLLPSVIYYIEKKYFLLFLENIVCNNHIKYSIPFYIRLRTPKDFRYGYGTKIDDKTYKMPKDSITGELNATIRFYNEEEIIYILKEKLNLRDYKIFHLDNQNEYNGEIILNSDIVITGIIN